MSGSGAAQRLRTARDRARDWLLAHIGADGRPEGAEVANGWSRLPWTLALTGETQAANAVLEWAARTSLAESGDFRPGPAYGAGRFAAYPLSHLAMGAILLERHDLAGRLLDRLAAIQDPVSGGMPIDPPGGEAAAMCDLLSTAQAGLAALAGGRMDIATRAHAWIVACLAQQPDLPNVLHVARAGKDLVTNPPANLRWTLSVDFSVPRQAYFYPGIAAVFLAGWAMKTGDREALRIGHAYLDLNIQGCAAQFDDLESVQICKFGWGAAQMQIADPAARYHDHLLRMAVWFVDHQSSDGSWTPSAFSTPEPNVVQRMTKTAEHAMEVTAILAALGTLSARG
jgi:hypothetical protein